MKYTLIIEKITDIDDGSQVFTPVDVVKTEVNVDHLELSHVFLSGQAAAMIGKAFLAHDLKSIPPGKQIAFQVTIGNDESEANNGKG